MKKTIALFLTSILLLSPFIHLSGQIASIDINTRYYFPYNAPDPFDVGANGIIIAGLSYNTDPESGNTIHDIMRIGTDGKLVWKKSMDLGVQYGIDYGVASADGNDFYLTTFEDVNTIAGGGENVTVTHFDVLTGEFTQKKYGDQKFGNILSMYANKDYMFILSCYHRDYWYNDEKHGRLSLLRIKKSTLELENLNKHEMSIGTPENGIFWQFLKVGEDYVDGYIVKDVNEKKISLLFARFDNDGKIIKTTPAEINLVNNFPTVSNSSLLMSRGISRGDIDPIILTQWKNNASTRVMSTMSWCFLMYEPESGHYFAYGILGSTAENKLITHHTGFHVSEFDENFKLLATKENSDLTLLTKNIEFNTHTPVYGRGITVRISTNKQLIANLYAAGDNFSYTVSMATLKCDEGVRDSENSIRLAGIYISTSEKMLTDKRTEQKIKYAILMTTKQCQYLMVLKKDKMTIYSEKIN